MIILRNKFIKNNFFFVSVSSLPKPLNGELNHQPNICFQCRGLLFDLQLDVSAQTVVVQLHCLLTTLSNTIVNVKCDMQ